jgi:hypothetical protein
LLQFASVENYSRMNWSRLALAGFAIYFASAAWATLSYVDPAPKGALVFQLLAPFENTGGFAWRVASRTSEHWRHLAHADQTVIYEDSTPLIVCEGGWREINELGHGRYLIEGPVIFLSSSDGSDPNDNGRRYWAVVPY